MSEHKNYISRHDESWEKFIDNYIIAYKSTIFDILSQKVNQDSKSDEINNKPKLAELWQNAKNISNEIHKIFSNWEKTQVNGKNFDIANDLIDMDYNTVSEVFKKISIRLYELSEDDAALKAKRLSNVFEEMWEIGEEHTTVIVREE